MAEAGASSFDGRVPEIYDRLMVPMLFAPYAATLAARVVQAAPRSVLETAAGTGAVTRALATALGPEAHIVATDFSADMLARARQHEPADPRIDWQQADAQELPFDDASFDAVVCQFGAMFFPDKAKAYGEARRVLRPGGLFLFDVWDGLATNEFAQVVDAALAELFPDQPIGFLRRLPHGYSDADLIAGTLAEAGFRDIVVAPLAATSRAASAEAAATAYCQGTPIRAEIASRRPDGLDAATSFVAQALGRRFGAAGPIEGRMQALVVSATA